MSETAARLRSEPGPARCGGTPGRRDRLAGVVLLLAALLVPVCVAGAGEPERAPGREECALVSPGAPSDAPAETDTASAPLGVLSPAGLPGEAVTLPEPSWTPLAPGGVDRPSGDAFRAFLAPPPRPGRT